MINTKRSNVVYLTGSPMLHLGGGYELRVASIGRALSKQFNLTNVAICGTDWNCGHNIKHMDFRKLEFACEESVSWGQRKPKAHLWGSRFDDAIMRSLLTRIDNIDPAWIYVGGIRVGAHAIALARAGHRLIVDMHNDEVNLAHQVLNTIPRRNWLNRKRFVLKLNRLRSCQTTLLNSAASISCCSDHDLLRFRQAGISADKLVVVPNEIPPGCKVVPRQPTPEPTAIFVGTLNYPPNVEGLRWFNQHVAPLLLHRHPQFRLLVAGRNPSPATTRELTRHAFIELHADSDNLSRLYERSNLSIVPLLSGGGTRIKLLEAAAFGLPSVSTSIGAEGLESLHSRCYWPGDTASDFANNMMRCFAEPAKRHEISNLAIETFGSAVIESALRHCVGVAMRQVPRHEQRNAG